MDGIRHLGDDRRPKGGTTNLRKEAWETPAMQAGATMAFCAATQLHDCATAWLHHHADRTMLPCYRSYIYRTMLQVLHLQDHATMRTGPCYHGGDVGDATLQRDAFLPMKPD